MEEKSKEMSLSLLDKELVPRVLLAVEHPVELFVSFTNMVLSMKDRWILEVSDMDLVAC